MPVQKTSTKTSKPVDQEKAHNEIKRKVLMGRIDAIDKQMAALDETKTTLEDQLADLD